MAPMNALHVVLLHNGPLEVQSFPDYKMQKHVVTRGNCTILWHEVELIKSRRREGFLKFILDQVRHLFEWGAQGPWDEVQKE